MLLTLLLLLLLDFVRLLLPPVSGSQVCTHHKTHMSHTQTYIYNYFLSYFNFNFSSPLSFFVNYLYEFNFLGIFFLWIFFKKFNLCCYLFQVWTPQLLTLGPSYNNFKKKGTNIRSVNKHFVTVPLPSQKNKTSFYVCYIIWLIGHWWNSFTIYHSSSILFPLFGQLGITSLTSFFCHEYSYPHELLPQSFNLNNNNNNNNNNMNLWGGMMF